MATEIPLLSDVGHSQLSLNADITMSEINQNHKLFIDDENTVDTNKLIEILGGTDAILQHYLSSNNLQQLTTKQLNQINELLAVAPTATNRSTDINLPSSTLLIWHDDTILHQIFGGITGNKIVNIMYNQGIKALASIGVIWLILIILKTGTIISFHSVRWIFASFVCIGLVFLLSLLLSVNKATARLILKRFEFWIKIVFFIKYWICQIIYDGFVVSNAFYNTYVSLMNTLIFAGLLVFSVVDGLKMSSRTKTIFTVIVCLLLSELTYEWMFLSEPLLLTFHPFHRFGGDYSWVVDMREWAAGSIRIVTIFAWRQTIYSAFKAPKSLIIQTPVKVQWL